MKLLLIAILITSATSAFAFGDDNGRYQVTSSGDNLYFIVIDTQTGKTQVCRHNIYVKPAVTQCSTWSNPDIFTDFSIN